MIHINKRRIGVTISIFTITLICLLILTMTYAQPPSPVGYLEWWNPDTADWELVTPSPNHLDLLPEDLPIELRICGLNTNWWDEMIQIKVSNEDWIYSSSRMVIVSGSGCAGPFTWPDPDHTYEYDICESNEVQYRLIDDPIDYSTNQVYIASGIIGGSDPGIIHVVPEFVFGTAMAVLSLFSGLSIYSKYKRK